MAGRESALRPSYTMVTPKTGAIGIAPCTRRTPRAVMASIAYIHENPVRRGLCAAGHVWRWSSARWYQGDKAYAAGFPPTIHGPPWDLDEPLPAIWRPW
jgi:hypothetical protein